MAIGSRLSASLAQRAASAAGWSVAFAMVLTAAPSHAAVTFPLPTEYTLIETDPSDCGGNLHDNRDLKAVLIFDDEVNHRIFIRYETWGLAGWKQGGQGIYKWAIDTTGAQVRYNNPSGTQIMNEEFFLFVWDNATEDKMGEVNLSYSGPDGTGPGWPPLIGPSTSCGSDCVGTGAHGVGGPQIAANHPDLGYRLMGNVVEMYVSYAALGSVNGTNPVGGLKDLCIVGAGEGTATNFNMDQASNCDSTANAVGVGVSAGVFCGSAPGALTIVKDTRPDYALAEFRFEVQGPSQSQQSLVLQDPGAAECTDPNSWAVCGTSPPWDREDRGSFTDLIGSNHPFEQTGPYRVVEAAGSGATLEAYETTWECRNVDPVACSPSVAASVDEPFTLDACDPVDPPARCAAAGWTDGVTFGEGPTTAPFDVCMGAHVVCAFTNVNQACLAAERAVGDLQAIGGVEGEPAGFATAAVPMRSGDAEDSIFTASFIPLAEGSRWPGFIGHFIQPLPLVENDAGQLVPDTSATCADAEDTGCLAWDAGIAILGQAPTTDSVGGDRRIGFGADERRVTYTTHTGSGVPRAIRAFDWSDDDPLASEYDLWDGFAIPYVAGDPASEDDARELAHTVINETLRIRQATINDPDFPPDGTTDLDFVLGDFFHADPVVVAAPANFFYLANDLEGNGAPCDDAGTPNRGYRCFFEKNEHRRRLLVAASNDGQVHAFDAGQFIGDVVNQRLDGEFTFGTGTEVFAHVVRPMLEHTQRMAALEHHFGVDGSLLVDDVFIDPLHDGVPEPAQREWRTVIFGTYREGERGVFALDVTQPDPIEAVPVLNFAGQPDTAWVPAGSPGVVPGCAGLGGNPAGGCGTLPFPSHLWEFQDQCLVVSSSGPPSNGSSCNDQLWDFDAQCASSGSQSFAVACDDDANGKPDLGFSWSQVNTGRILVRVQGQAAPVAKFVAVFGGGLDATDKSGIGNWLYMVDVETGKAIYKRSVTGAVPSEPAAVDTNQDGFLDTLYVGTTSGLMYKVDLSTPADLDPTSGRLDTASQWSPFAIFDTEGRPIYYPPTVTFVASQGRYALAFGTGEREDLFSPEHAGQEGRFYMILDSGFEPASGVLSSGPLTEASFQQIEALGDGTSGDFLTAPLSGKQPGWVLELAPNERVVTKALLLSGLTVFTTFHPLSPDICEFSGNGSVYALLATNANSIAGPTEDRAITDEGFFGRAVVTPTGMTTAGLNGEQIDPFESARIRGIRDNLMDLFPADCRFGSFSLNVGVTLSNTSILSVASVPVCVARENWTEHF